MKDLKVYIPEELEKEFKKRSMEAYGYGRGSISKAAAEAIQRWTSEREAILSEFPPPDDPVGSLRGMLRHVKISSVQLQHEAKKIRAGRLGSH